MNPFISAPPVISSRTHEMAVLVGLLGIVLSIVSVFFGAFYLKQL